MHPDIEKLINIAKESGELTEKQKEIILRKAEKLGEDVDEVEMILVTLFPKPTITKPETVGEKRMKCPNCGALISKTSFVCPECGYTFQRENHASIEARNAIDKLSHDLQNVAPLSTRESWLDEDAESKRKATIINTFTMPTTREGLCLFLEFSYSAYIGTPDNDQVLREAWKGKTLQAYNTLSRIGENDPDIRALLDKYSSLISQESKRVRKNNRKVYIVCAVLLIFSTLLIHNGAKHDRSIQDQVEICIQNHDYQGAKAAAQKYSGDTDKLLDDISVQEISHLISIGEFQHAEVVAASINDEEKRESMIESIKSSYSKSHSDSKY